MKILFIGGTKFVGRNIVEKALEEGHQVSLLQRGITNSDIFKNTTRYLGDRKEIENLIPQTQTYDLVVDTCGYHPAVVEKSAQLLKNRTDKYIFISTGSVYSDFSRVGLNENSPVQTSNGTPDIHESFKRENYGLLKAKCEDVVRKNFPLERHLILRPCIIVGKYDDTNRFNYWVDKIKNSSSIEIPDDKKAYIQFIDVRALADFVLNSHKEGTFNLIGPKEKITFLEFIHLAKKILNSDVKLIPTPAEKLQVPMYTPDQDWKGFFQFDGSKAYSQGLHSYLVEDTVRYVAHLS